MSTGGFAEREREKAKRERAEHKRARREGRREEEAAPAPPAERGEDEVLAALDALHRAFDDDQLTLEDFEAKRAELLAQLRI